MTGTVLFLLILQLASDLTPVQAEKRAADLWGYSGKAWRVRVIRIDGPAWEYRVGCKIVLAGQQGLVTVVAGAGSSWAEAFKQVDLAANGVRALPMIDGQIRKAYACNPPRTKFP